MVQKRVSRPSRSLLEPKWGDSGVLTNKKGSYLRRQQPFPQQAAVVELDQWDGVNFDRTRATLRLAFTEQHGRRRRRRADDAVSNTEEVVA